MSQQPNRVAEMRIAFSWICDECGRENFESPFAYEMTDENREDVFRQLHDLEPWQQLPDNWEEFNTLKMPVSVMCRSCGEVHDTIYDS